MPFIGRLKRKCSKLVVHSGYNTWGITNGSLAGKILLPILSWDNTNPYIDLFSPHQDSLNISKVISFQLMLEYEKQ